MDVLQLLKKVDSFDTIPVGQLLWLIENSELRDYAKGEMLFIKGESIDCMSIILKGNFAIKIQQNGQFRHLGFFGAHEITGKLPYSRAEKASGFGEATVDSQVLSLKESFFDEMIKNHYELTTVLVHYMSSRIRRFTKLEQQNDKMMALGKLSAGLAHELNNPSAAVIRSAQELIQT